MSARSAQSDLRTIALGAGADLDGFRAAARRLVADAARPQSVAFSEGGEATLFSAGHGAADAPPIALPRSVSDLVGSVVMHRDPERYALLYALIWRVLQGERALLETASDPLVHRLGAMRKNIGRDLHKMHAFLRFRRAGEVGPRERFVAWFEPEHHILRAAAPFFRDRYAAFDWSILTPDGSAHWDGAALSFGPPGRREDAPAEDAFEAGWLGYYESTFNPARTNTRVMQAEMPKKYWRNMPETQSIPAMVRAAANRTELMIDAAPSRPAKRDPALAVAAMANDRPSTLEELNAIIARSEPQLSFAARAVLGEGPLGADIAFVGEQPGDQEEAQGRPFVGPAGQLLDRALAEAGIDRRRQYLTNAVKRFKFELRGKRRIHQKPTAGEVSYHRWWLDLELDFVAPKLVVALGATAALALAGKAVSVTKTRGPATFGERPFPGFVTVHPSFLLRLPDEASKTREFALFVSDLRRAGELAGACAA